MKKHQIVFFLSIVWQFLISILTVYQIEKIDNVFIKIGLVSLVLLSAVFIVLPAYQLSNKVIAARKLYDLMSKSNNIRNFSGFCSLVYSTFQYGSSYEITYKRYIHQLTPNLLFRTISCGFYDSNYWFKQHDWKSRERYLKFYLWFE